MLFFLFPWMFVLDNPNATIDHPHHDVTCTRTFKPIENRDVQIFEQACRIENIETVSICYPDAQGRCAWTYELIKHSKAGPQLIELSELFVQNTADLEAILNQEIKKARQTRLAANPSTCLQEVKEKSYVLNDFSMSLLEPDQVAFVVDYGLSPECITKSREFAYFTYSDLKTYME